MTNEKCLNISMIHSFLCSDSIERASVPRTPLLRLPLKLIPGFSSSTNFWPWGATLPPTDIILFLKVTNFYLPKFVHPAIYIFLIKTYYFYPILPPFTSPYQPPKYLIPGFWKTCYWFHVYDLAINFFPYVSWHFFSFFLLHLNNLQ